MAPSDEGNGEEKEEYKGLGKERVDNVEVEGGGEMMDLLGLS